MSLYSINAQILQALSMYEQDSEQEIINEETGEILSIADYLNELKMDFADKVENCVLYMKNLKADEEAIQHEIDNLEERLKAKKNKRERMEQYVGSICDEKKYESPKYCLKLKTSVQTIAPTKQEEIMKLPECYRTPSTTWRANKTNIKKAIENGASIEGCALQSKKNLNY